MELDVAREATCEQVILIAARELAGDTGREILLTQLVVRSWEIDRLKFGLEFFERTYPDSKLVECAIYKKKSRLKAWLMRIGQKRYRLTEVGYRAAERLRPTAAGS